MNNPSFQIVFIALFALCAHQQCLGQTSRSALIPVYESTTMERTILSDDEIKEALKTLAGWEYSDGKLAKTFDCGSFRKAIAFIVAMAFHCEAIDHHPEIFNVYGKVQITTTTYDIGQKVTTDDLKLATAIEATANEILSVIK